MWLTVRSIGTIAHNYHIDYEAKCIQLLLKSGKPLSISKVITLSQQNK
jgi:hypothetical protein